MPNLADQPVFYLERLGTNLIVSPRPAIFVSAVSCELRSARQLVANTLTFLGYDPEWQEVFGTEEGDLRAMLRRRIDACKGVVQLVGECYGAEPPVIDEQFGRVSYTQYEALYGSSRGKRVWYLFLDETFPTDAHEAEGEAKTGLQNEYRAKLRAQSHLYHPLRTVESLEATVLKLRDDLTQLRRGVRRWTVFVVVILLLLVGLGLWNLQRQNESREEVNRQLTSMREIIRRLPQKEAEQRQIQPNEEPEMARKRAVEELAKQYGLAPSVLERKLPLVADELKHEANATTYERANAAYVAMDYNEAERLALAAADQALGAFPRKETEAIKALELAAWAADRRIEYADAMKRLYEAQDLTNRDSSPLEWARVQFGIALVLHDQGKYREAERILREVLKEREQALGSEGPETLAVRHSLATALEDEGRYVDAETEYRAVAVLRGKVLGSTHPDSLSTRNNLANALDDQGKYPEAESEYRIVLRLRENVLGPEHPDTLGTRHNLAGVLDDEGKYLEAEAEYRAVLKLREKVLGPEHPDTLATRGNLAEVIDNEGRYSEAEAEYRAVLKLKEKVLGPEHPKTLLTQGNLAAVLIEQGKYAEAENEDRIVIRLRAKVLGAEHPETLAARHDLADVLNKEGEYLKAENEYRDLITLEQRVLGSEHRFTLESCDGLAFALFSQRKYSEAEADYRAVLKLKQKVLGSEHPDTLRTFYNLALCLRSDGQIQEARAFAQRAADGAVKVLGSEHPDTKRYQQLQQELNAS